ncbi:hypothetical protein Trydic_g9229 [Trypoxylus dichotomus]
MTLSSSNKDYTPQTTTAGTSRKTNWDLHKTCLRDNLNQLNTGRIIHHLKLEQDVEFFSGAITEAFEVRKDTSWWNRNRANLRFEVCHLFNKAKVNEDWQRYKEKQNFCENITSTPVAVRFHKTMAKGGIRPVMALRKSDGSYTEGEKERVNLLLETHLLGSKQTHLEEAPGCQKGGLGNCQPDLYKAAHRVDNRHSPGI